MPTDRGVDPAAKFAAAAKLGVLHCGGMLGALLKFAVAFVVRLPND
jgi:hypothetical protein